MGRDEEMMLLVILEHSTTANTVRIRVINPRGNTVCPYVLNISFSCVYKLNYCLCLYTFLETVRFIMDLNNMPTYFNGYVGTGETLKALADKLPKVTEPFDMNKHRHLIVGFGGHGISMK
jgi:hypothetical protein